MKTTMLVLGLAATLVFAGCATSSHEHSSGGMGMGMMMASGKGMGCGKCSCKTMVKSEAEPMKCKMCGHDASEHNKPAEGSTDHSAHQH